MLSWRIYYGDGTTFDNTCGAPCNAPPLNCQCVVVNTRASTVYRQLEDTGRMVLHGWDYCLYRSGIGWFGLDNLIDLVDYILFEVNNVEAVLKGRSISLTAFKDIYRRAWLDKDFPPKSAISKEEAPTNKHFGALS